MAEMGSLINFTKKFLYSKSVTDIKNGGFWQFNVTRISNTVLSLI